MRAVITGATGSVGREAADALLARGVELIPIVRSLDALEIAREHAFEADLASGEPPSIRESFDCVVHAAGDVRFKAEEGANEKMMRSVLTLAKERGVPVYYVSTAYLHRPEGVAFVPVNAYEKDKKRAEELLASSGVPHGILRPAIVTGRRSDGRLMRFTGFYQAAALFVAAARRAKSEGRLFRFPRIKGKTALVPVDDVAQALAAMAEEGARGTRYAALREPPELPWLIEAVLRTYRLEDAFAFEGRSFADFRPESDEERALAALERHFGPYWARADGFPAGGEGKPLDGSYIERILRYYDAHAADKL